MAPKQSKTARKPPPSQPQTAQQPSRPLLEILTPPVALLTLAALASPISQAALAPVFGSIPSAINHSEAIAATPLLGFLWRWQFKRTSPESVLGYLSAWAFWIPVISMYLFGYSAQLGIVYGPVLIGFLSCHTFIIGASYAAAAYLEELNLEAKLGPYTAPLLLALLGVLHVVSFEMFSRTILPGLQTLTAVFTPVKTQAVIASTLAYLSHSKTALLGLPALVHVFSANPHFDSARTLNNLNTTLNRDNWSILARQWSNTGYISILDNTEEGFRVMRADHSLLGGEFVINDHRRYREGWQVNEPIYAVFQMLEAVRLVPTEPTIPDTEAQALIIGLGIGTAPKAFLAHGIDTTVIELDPAVHEYAIKYFDLPTNHTSILQDAVSAVADLAHPPAKQYDFIIHDVFTGGAEPLALFTHAFLRNLHAILKSNGIVAINYAGQADSPLTVKVLRTIRSVFGPSCRGFRDLPPSPPANEGKDGEEEEDILAGFANMVIFCRSGPGHPEPVTFRRPTTADFLGRQSAKQSLLPRPEYEVALPELLADGEGLLEENGLDEWTQHQTQSAIRHWKIMRKVVPDFVWELY